VGVLAVAAVAASILFLFRRRKAQHQYQSPQDDGYVANELSAEPAEKKGAELSAGLEQQLHEAPGHAMLQGSYHTPIEMPADEVYKPGVLPAKSHSLPGSGMTIHKK
jgi:hypothetical protein